MGKNPIGLPYIYGQNSLLFLFCFIYFYFINTDMYNIGSFGKECLEHLILIPARILRNSAIGLFGALTNFNAGRGSSIGSTSAWHADGRGFYPHIRETFFRGDFVM